MTTDSSRGQWPCTVKMEFNAAGRDISLETQSQICHQEISMEGESGIER